MLSSASSRATCWQEGEGFKNPARKLNDDEYDHELTSISKMVWTLIQDITYLTIRYMCSYNKNIIGLIGLVVAFTKRRYDDSNSEL
jgi:hypothetical protein